MNVFDIIRYKGTDLGSLNELGALPEGLVAVYNKNLGLNSYNSHQVRCMKLVRIYNMHVAVWPPTTFYEAFNSALKEYNP